jgi:uncharacterized protein YcfL
MTLWLQLEESTLVEIVNRIREDPEIRFRLFLYDNDGLL